LYLNDGWKQGDGGELRILQKGSTTDERCKAKPSRSCTQLRAHSTHTITHKITHAYTHESRTHSQRHARTKSHAHALRTHEIPLTKSRTHARTHAQNHARTHACTHAHTHSPGAHAVVRIQVAPLLGRLLLFWSDERVPPPTSTAYSLLTQCTYTL
jgi:hypothetical protein